MLLHSYILSIIKLPFFSLRTTIRTYLLLLCFDLSTEIYTKGPEIVLLINTFITFLYYERTGKKYTSKIEFPRFSIRLIWSTFY